MAGRTKEYGHASRHNVFATYRLRARKKGIPFTITEEEFKIITDKDCYYCGYPPSNKLNNHRYNGSLPYSGIDRVDNSKGYETENCVPCCKWCNGMKSSLSTEQFLKHVRRICGYIDERLTTGKRLLEARSSYESKLTANSTKS